VAAFAAVACAALALAATPASASIHIPAGSFSSYGSAAGHVQLNASSGLAVNASTHDVYVADTNNVRVDQFSAAGVFLRAWGWGVADGLPVFETCTLVCQSGIQGSAAGQFETPVFIAVDNSAGPSAGDVYVGDTGTNTVLKFSASGSYISTNDGSGATAPLAGPFGPLAGVTVDGSGDVWVYDTNANMFEFAQDGSFITDWNSGRGVTPNGIDVDAEGNVYVLTGGGSIEQFTAAGTDVGPVNGDASDPTGFAVDRSSGDVYMDSGGILVRHYPASCDAGGSCTAADTFGSGNLSGAAGLAVDASNGTVYAADSGDESISVFTVPVPGAPLVDSTSVANVTSSSADLGGQVNPDLLDTSYHFQYGPSSAYGQSTPESSPIGSGYGDQPANAHIQGLVPNTTYHFRVVASNSLAPGGAPGPDHTFTTQPTSSPVVLPDNRGYELVTPVNKVDGELGPPARGGQTAIVRGNYQASITGDRMVFTTATAFPGAQSGAAGDWLASRGPGGWSSQALSPRQANGGGWASVTGYSLDLSKAVMLDGGYRNVGQDDPPLVGGEPANNRNLFLRDNIAGSYQLMNAMPGVSPADIDYLGASPDLNHVVFESEFDYHLYQWFGGAVDLVSQIPSAPATSCGSGGPACVAVQGDLGAGHTFPPLNAVSSDGSKIFFKRRSGSSPLPAQLYVRENGTRTAEVSASQKTNGTGPGGSDPNAPHDARYWTATPDGSEVFFSSCDQLTNNSTASSTGDNPDCSSQSTRYLTGQDLYRYDTNSGALADLSADHHGDPNSADVQGVLGASADGSYVYFVANGVLAPGASFGNCANQTGYSPSGSDGCNLYVAHNGTTTFIARLGGNDFSDWSGLYNDGDPSEGFTARVTPDGKHMAFESVRGLTGFDNRDASTGRPDNEVFLYDASTSQLACASCNPSGAQPTGDASILGSEEAAADGVDPGWNSGLLYLPRNLSDDGSRLFFETTDALVAGDVNGLQDVYEYENGRPRLISSGTSGVDSSFFDASPSGNDVFFETQAQLAPQDVDHQLDIYDARVGGGFPSTPVGVACSGDACKAPPSGSVPGVAPGSASFAGPGNPGVAGVQSKAKVLTRAQLLTRALRVCAKKPRRQRAACRAHARKLHGAKKAARAAGAVRRAGK
jgi:sugar lactone lactonase YvrE